ncbi:disease resistance protein, partial [Trifolium medium]|nr:disease resistance protein [Trifolium medium]
MKVIVTEFDKLLKYNLTFINRAEEKSTFFSNTHHIKFTSAIRSKLRFPEAIPEQVVKVVSSMCDDLDKMLNQLKEAEAAAGRNACIKQLKAIVEELNKFHVNSPKFNQIEIKNAIDLLQHLTNTCIIQFQRQDSTNVVGLKIKERDLVLNLTAASSDNNASKICIIG